jgi:hypothetical protein
MTTTDPGREVKLVAGDRTYTLYAGNRALRLIERETGTSLLALFSEDGLEQLGIGTLTTLVWGLLQRDQPAMTIDDVDEVIDAAGYDAVMDALTKALEVALPKPAAAPDGAAPGKAPAPSGTGTRSSPAPSRPGSASPSSGR